MTRQWSKNTVLMLPKSCVGIGDHLIFTRLPEEYYKQFGQNLRFLANDCHDIWKYHPYVDLIKKSMILPHDKVINLWWNPETLVAGSPVYKHTSRFVKNINCNLKPTMGRSSNGIKQKKTVMICSQGKQKSRINHCEKIPTIELCRLTNGFDSLGYRVIQIGGPNDDYIDNTEDCRGLSIQDTYDTLGECSIFVGPNSGMMHLANTVEHIRVVVYMETDVTLPISSLDNVKYPHHDWLYDDNEFIGPKRYENVTPIDEFLERL
ncbi:hypothetical protein KAR91_86925 [Candidatus Pacearchaeota archaeon]|nr:hypothetical protein [Candidatus Pacearchaeota archaeon]